MNLPDLNLPPTINTSTANMATQLYEPALSVSIRYDRGVGYFSSGWLRVVARGLAQFAANGGQARIITSPILSQADWEALQTGTGNQLDVTLRAAITRNIDILRQQLEEDTLSTLAWMVADEILIFKLALPQNKLARGDFHDKFGIFTDQAGNQVSFSGSPNESERGFYNYESNKIFKSWLPSQTDYVQDDAARFELLWHNEDENVGVYSLPEAARAQIIRLRQEERPYPEPERIKSRHLVDQKAKTSNKWRHQDKALDLFLQVERGILNMATGTGKTRTSFKILKRLIADALIDTIIVTTDGNDLLTQWYKQLLQVREDLDNPFRIFRHYEDIKEQIDFNLNPQNAILVCSRRSVGNALRRLSPQQGKKTLLVHDEVHGLGSPGNRNNLSGLSDNIRFRLGLSATPEREYDNEGNQFIEEHIGPEIMSFGLQEAIERGILAPFNYLPLEYKLLEEDKQMITKIFAKKAARAKEGRPMSDAELFIEIARVYKTSRAKLPIFEDFIAQNPHLLERCIIFVEETEYGMEVLEIVHKHRADFHSYFSGEDAATLARFASGDLECLLTCHRLSEGIDIQSLRNVILFSSSRALLETIQRIGRCIRVDPNNPDKVANIVDFIRHRKNGEDGDTMNPDLLRAEWLTKLSRVRPLES